MSFQIPITIADAIQNIGNNRYLLPAIQREYVWWYTNIEWLFDSIMRKYPINSFLFWDVQGDTKKKFKFYSFIKNYREVYNTHNPDFDASRGHEDFTAILDGQQRLTSLYIGLQGSFAYKKYRAHWVDNEENLPTRLLYLNIEHKMEENDEGMIYEFKFLATKEYEAHKDKWFRVGDMLAIKNFSEFNKYMVEHKYNEKDFASTTLATLHEAIHSDKLINYFLVKEQDIDRALDIFIRINSGGEPLSFSDLIMSITIAHWKGNAKTEIHSLVDEIRDMGFFINKDFILKVYLFLYSSDIRYKVNNFTAESAINFENNWDNIKTAIKSVFRLIKTYGFVESTLTSKNALLPVVYYIYHKGISNNFSTKVEYKADRRIIEKWLHIVLLKRIFGGQADGLLAKIRGIFTSDFKNNFINPALVEFPHKQMAKAFAGTNKDLSFDTEFFENLLYTQKDDNYAFSILSLLYPNLDYKNNNFHKDHLHPISSFTEMNLKKLGIPKDKYEFYLDSEYNNSILNLHHLDANENMSKQHKPLKDWVEAECKSKKPAIDKFCKDRLFPNILEFVEFEDFIEQRKALLIAKFKEICV